MYLLKDSISISVIVPTYNRANQLNTCLSSLFEQDYADEYEVVVVDDGSNDETRKLLQKFSRKYPNLKVIRNQENKGSYYSRNLGVSFSKGNVVAFTDSDCIVPKDWLSKIHRAFQNSEVSCIQGTHERRGKWELPIPKEQLLNHPVFRIRKALDTKNLAIRKDLFLKYKFDERLWTGGDQDLGHRLSEDQINILYDTEVSVIHNDKRSFWETICKGRSYGKDYAYYYKKRGWKSVNPKLRYPLWLLFFYYIGGFFFFLLRYRSFRGAVTSAAINFLAAFHFKKSIGQYPKQFQSL